jgi:hypothetical protein
MQYSNAGGMLVALGAMVVLVLLCRWVFATGDRDQRAAMRLQKAQSRGDYGLLVPVTTARTPEHAEQLRVVLRDNGIRGTVATAEQPGERVVLVFRADEERARTLVSS